MRLRTRTRTPTYGEGPFKKSCHPNSVEFNFYKEEKKIEF